MQRQATRAISGHVFKIERKRGPQWYAKYRLPDGRQVQRRIGPHWTDRKQEPPAGYFTKTTARAWLDDTLAKARRGELPGMVRTGTTFAVACDDWLDYKRDRKIKLSTQIDYEHMIDRMKKVFGDKFGEKRALGGRDAGDGRGLPRRPGRRRPLGPNRQQVPDRAARAFRLGAAPLQAAGESRRNVERRPHAKRGNIDVFSREEVLALVRAAASKQDGDDLPDRGLHRPAAGRAARPALARRGLRQQRDPRPRRASPTGASTRPRAARSAPCRWPTRSPKRSPGSDSASDFTRRRRPRLLRSQGGHLAGHKLRDRYKAALKKAGLRELRFHDLRHTFGIPRDPHRRLPRGHGVDGPPGLGDDAALPPVQAAPGRGPPYLRRLQSTSRRRRTGRHSRAGRP